jgi:exonuclease SbcC
MRLNYISLKNYRRFKSTELELPEGMVSIMGPNGAGKSSLMEAVAWALYGNESEIVRTGKESIKREGSAGTDPCSVRIEFDLEDVDYAVERSMKGKNLSMNATLHAGNKLMARGSDEVTKAVEKIFGMDHKSFFISVFARQKELNALTSYPKHQRKSLVLHEPHASCQAKVALRSNDGGGWVERQILTYSALSEDGSSATEVTAHEQCLITVSGMGNNDDIDLLLKEITVLGAGATHAVSIHGFTSTDSASGVTYVTSTGGDIFASKTPDAGDNITWEAFEVA